ncbi:MAG: signal peptide peptidase SppA [Chitinophagaceae bacterium]
MRTFFKIFFASLLAIIVSVVVLFFIGVGIIASASSKLINPETASTGSRGVLMIDLGLTLSEQGKDNPLAKFSSEEIYSTPGLYDAVRLIKYAKSDSSIKGIYLKCNDNPNGFATSQELRNALLDFKTSKKFIYAYGDVIPERAYYVANLANKIYCNPKGGLEWKGYALNYMFFKQTLQRLEIEPQIFYAGKFKSATEPLREEKMTEPNRVQSRELLSFLYNELLVTTAAARGLDTASLHDYANKYLIRTADDAARLKLIDGVRYYDEVQGELKSMLKIEQSANINMVALGKYAESVNYKKTSGTDRIALIYAEGDIVDGKGESGQIGSETFRDLVRKARMDDKVKAIVFRVNSGGGSALASENIWREITITRKTKPVILSFGDVAASGGYYLAANADSIFAEPTTITGSIGVFTIIPNMQRFFKNKLGVTFDGVKTADHADAMTVSKPLTDIERSFIQSGVDTIYETFKTRVSEGRKLSMVMVDSIGQGRVWMGKRALELGLVDRLGNIQDAIDCAARMAKLKSYGLREFPEPKNFLDILLGNYQKVAKASAIKEEMGEEAYSVYIAVKKVKSSVGIAQARMPFEISIK